MIAADAMMLWLASVRLGSRGLGGLGVTSKCLCQGEDGRDALVCVFVGEYGEENTVHRGFVLECSHRTGASAHFAEAAFDGVGGAHLLALGEALVAPASEQLVEIVSLASNGVGIGFSPPIGEAARGGARLRHGRRG